MASRFATLALVAFLTFSNVLSVKVIREAEELCEDYKKCFLVDVDYAIAEADEVTILGVTMPFNKRVQRNNGKDLVVEFGDVFQNVEFSMNENADGTFSGLCAVGQTTAHGDFEIEHVSGVGYVLGVGNTRPDDDGTSMGPKEMAELQAMQATNRAGMSNARYDELLKKGKEDTTTTTEVTVTVYYTAASRAWWAKDKEDDFMAFIQGMFQSAKDTFTNSAIKINLKLHCLQKADYIEKGKSTVTILKDFTGMGYTFNGGFPTNLNGADIAILLVSGVSGCGQAWVGVPGAPYAVVDVHCAWKKYSLAHEIGHLFGGDHNVQDTEYDEGEGHGIWYDGFGDKYRSCMAYQETKIVDGKKVYTGRFGIRVNRYSNTVKTFKDGDKVVPNGIKGLADNASLLSARRFVMAGINDEKGTCEWRK